MDRRPKDWLRWLPVKAWEDRHRSTYHKGPWWGFVKHCVDNEATDRKGGHKFIVEWELGFGSTDLDADIEKWSIGAKDRKSGPNGWRRSLMATTSHI